MLVGLVIEEESINVISAYAPQVGLREAKKKSFWDSLDDFVRECSSTQQLIIAGDLNGHIGANADGFSSMHEGFGYGVRNEEGRTILEFAAAHDLVVVNSFFKKRDAHLITFHSRVHDTQIDYMLVRKWDLTLSEAFRARVIEEVIPEEEDRLAPDAEQMWNRLANTIREAAKETLGVVAGTLRMRLGHRESWWISDEIQKEKGLRIVRFIKDRDGRSIVNEDAIRRRWKEYFSNLFNEQRIARTEELDRIGASQQINCYCLRIRHSEVKKALRKMGRTRRWDLMRSSLKHGGVLEVRWLTTLFNKTFLRAKIPDEWRLIEGGDSTGYDVRVRLLAVNEVTIINKMREGRLRWFEHVKRRPQSAPLRRVESLTVDEARRRGRPKLRWEDRPKTDLKEMLLSKDMTSDRNAWRTRIRVVEGAWVFLEAVPLPSGRGVTVYISPPLYLVYAGL
nr:craniofacial development protein 2 [Tanacetum cinerariifolium]